MTALCPPVPPAPLMSHCALLSGQAMSQSATCPWSSVRGEWEVFWWTHKQTPIMLYWLFSSLANSVMDTNINTLVSIEYPLIIFKHNSYEWRMVKLFLHHPSNIFYMGQIFTNPSWWIEYNFGWFWNQIFQASNIFISFSSKLRDRDLFYFAKFWLWDNSVIICIESHHCEILRNCSSFCLLC